MSRRHHETRVGEWRGLAEDAHDEWAAQFRANRRLLSALHLIASTGCRSYTTGLGSCHRNGRASTAQYEADRCCDPCIAAAALHPIRGVRT